jgi:hypothetical protein
MVVPDFQIKTGRMPILWNDTYTKSNGFSGRAEDNAMIGRFFIGYDVDGSEEVKRMTDALQKEAAKAQYALVTKREYKIQKLAQGVPEHEIKDDASLEKLWVMP